MVLVQVNPGETFTVSTDDGQIQCITGNTSRRADTYTFIAYPGLIRVSAAFCWFRSGAGAYGVP